MALRNLLLKPLLEHLAELVTVMPQANELQRQLQAMPHGDAQRELVGTRVCALDLADAEEWKDKGTRVPVGGDKREKRVGQGQLACPGAVAR